MFIILFIKPIKYLLKLLLNFLGQLTVPANNQHTENNSDTEVDMKSGKELCENPSKNEIKITDQSLFDIEENFSKNCCEKTHNMKGRISFSKDYKHWNGNIGSYVRKKDKLKRKNTQCSK